MKAPFLSAILFLTLCFENGFSQSAGKSGNVKIKVPTEWINALHTHDYGKSNKALLEQFENFVKPDILFTSLEDSHDNEGILNPMFVNLDDDPTDELIGLFGWSETYPTLAVFKEINNSWYLIYLQPFYMFYGSPELQVANNPSHNKTFYIRWLYNRGSGIYCDAYHFYKVINDTVYPCLRLINKAYIYGWGMYMNQKVEMKFQFECTTKDEIDVSYNYSFFPGPVYDGDVSWSAHEDMPFIKDAEGAGADYDWNEKAHKYVLNSYDSIYGLTEDKITCFGAFGNDTFL